MMMIVVVMVMTMRMIPYAHNSRNQFKHDMIIQPNPGELSETFSHKIIYSADSYWVSWHSECQFEYGVTTLAQSLCPIIILYIIKYVNWARCLDLVEEIESSVELMPSMKQCWSWQF